MSTDLAGEQWLDDITDEWDPELLEALPHVIATDLTDVPFARQSRGITRSQLWAAGFLPDEPEGLRVDDREIARDDGTLIPARVYRVESHEPPIGALLHIHGGAFVLGDLDEERNWAVGMAASGFLVLSIEYALAPEHPFPAGLEDAYRALLVLPKIAAEYGVRDEPVVVGGLSAGGNLTAAVCLLARQRGGPRIALQVLNQACLDDRLSTPSMLKKEVERRREAIDRMWDLYLGDLRGATPALAAPALESDLTGLPPALIIAAEMDPLLDEELEYANRLRLAGVPVTVFQAKGAYHGFDDAAPLAATSRAAHAIIVDAARSALEAAP
jgi:acetyl esterase